ncbi:hypothetical protein JXB12_09025 [candidate division KSB1 bacterium]|nr:hypothetical protein [candidate division KSB1 bacterium]
MSKNVMLVLLSTRKEVAVKVQQILTAWGCYIKTRLGLHSDTLENCSENGLLFLEMVGDEDKHKEMERKLNLINGVNAKLIKLSIDE